MKSTKINKKMILLFTFSILVNSVNAFAAKYYVSPAGKNSNLGTLSAPFKTIQYAMNQVQPGDTVYVRSGVYRNNNYGNGDSNGSVVDLTSSHSGTANNRVTLRNYNNEKPIIEFDGKGGIIAEGLKYFRIQGFEIRGPNQSISLATARSKAIRCSDNRIAKYSGRGIAIWPSASGSNHHIEILNNVVHDAPASGIRVNAGDYITIEGNELYNNTWYTPAAESALTIAAAKSFDNNNTVKIIVRGNYVHHNYNRVAFYKGNANVPGNGNSNYGTCEHTKIVDGQGIYMTRSTGYTSGWTVFENNIAAFNGMNGITFHKSNKGKIINNTVYKNGYTKVLDPVNGNINWSGITVNNAATARVENNIIWGRDNNCLRKVCDSPGCSNISYSNNLYYKCNNLTLVGNRPVWNQNPLFVGGTVSGSASTTDYKLANTSPAIAAGLANNAPSDDFSNNGVRPGSDGLVAIGAFERDINSPAQTVPSIFRLQNVNSGKWLKSVSSDGKLVATSNTGNYTKWERLNAGNGFVYLENVANSKRLKGQSNSVPLVSDTSTGDFVKWSIVDAGNNDYYIINKYHDQNNTGTPNLYGDTGDNEGKLSGNTGSRAKWKLINAN